MVDFSQAYEDAGKQYNLDPALLRSMARVESNEQNTDQTGRLITSSAGAQGWMQFMPATAKQYGVDVTDPRSSIFGAAHYMSDLLTANGGNLPAALASYNGSGGDASQTYAKQIVARYQQAQTDQQKAQQQAGATSESQPDPRFIDIGSSKPPAPSPNLTGQTGTAVNDFRGVLTGKGEAPTTTAAAPPAPTPTPPAPNDFRTVLGGGGGGAPVAPAAPPAVAAPAAPSAVPVPGAGGVPTVTVTAARPPAPAAPAAAVPAPAAAPQPVPSDTSQQPPPAAPAATPPPAPVAQPAAPVAPAAATPQAPPVPAPVSAPAIPPQLAGQSASATPPASWWQRNVGMPVNAMMRPDLGDQQAQNYLLNVPLLQSAGAGIVQGTRDVAQTISNWGEAANARVPWLDAIDRDVGWFPPQGSTLPQQTQAFNQQYASDIPAQLSRIGGEIGSTPGVMMGARAVGALAEAAPIVGRYLAPIVSGAFGGGAQNLLVSGGTGQDAGQALATGAAGGGALGGLFGAAGAWMGRNASAVIDAAADRLGIRLSQGQRVGGIAKRVEDTTKILPGSGASRFAQDQREDITRVIAREAGIPGPVRQIDTATLNAAETRAGDAIENAARRITIQPNQRFTTDLGDIVTRARQAGPATQQAATADSLGTQLLHLLRNNGGQLPGAEFQRFISRGGPIDTALNSSVPEVRAVGTAMREALFRAAESSGTASREALRDLAEARYQWKVIQTVRPAVTRTLTGTDEMSLPGLSNAIRNEFDMRRFGPGNDMQDLARLISGPLRDLPSSGTAERAAWQRWLGLGGAEAGPAGLMWALGQPHLAETYLAATGIPLAATAVAGRLSRFGPGLGIPSLEAAREGFNPLLPRLMGPHVGNQLLAPPQGQAQ